MLTHYPWDYLIMPGVVARYMDASTDMWWFFPKSDHQSCFLHTHLVMCSGVPVWLAVSPFGLVSLIILVIFPLVSKITYIYIIRWGHYNCLQEGWHVRGKIILCFTATHWWLILFHSVHIQGVNEKGHKDLWWAKFIGVAEVDSTV